MRVFFYTICIYICLKTLSGTCDDVCSSALHVISYFDGKHILIDTLLIVLSLTSEFKLKSKVLFDTCIFNGCRNMI